MCAVRWMELKEICEGEVGLESAAHILRAIACICFGVWTSFEKSDESLRALFLEKAT